MTARDSADPAGRLSLVGPLAALLQLDRSTQHSACPPLHFIKTPSQSLPAARKSLLLRCHILIPQLWYRPRCSLLLRQSRHAHLPR